MDASGGTEKLIGGLADNRPERTFDPEALADGIRHEKEHTTSEAVASEIARDHLQSDSDYYDKLEDMENETSSSSPEDDTNAERSKNSLKSQQGLERAAMSANSVNAVREFAANLYAAYYES